MKKSILLLLLAVFLVNGSAKAQWSNNKVNGNGKIVTQTRTTGDYDGIKIAGSFDVDLVAGKEGKITIKGEENLLAVIKVEVEENELKIYVEKGTQIRTSIGKKIEVIVPFEKISAVTLSGSGDIRTKNKITSDNLSTKLSGSGNFNLEIDAKNLDLALSGSGDVVLKGRADSFTSKISGSGNVNASNLKSKNVEANVSGSGNSTVNCESSLTGKVSGSGNIKYLGNPEKRDVKVSGSGSISKG
ncbi:head GIN domain-containing protein [Flavobacterium sp. S87F.05.LMB.W.Kidney.N]|uniref:head GIN domain-containing protein n=1 Tax=Flavobacterium sp. S87F.05.LMB.W.Kidney.N TaxID=1278758 RepID=UPI001066D33E|nr:head GIN domain-containing protein [Flavobacterium sp. S87F.05.LMB.W.Kidney.N]TDX10201.1 putative autotransporter adhesin-like protein [Flavobacterium sp. S87F.05.LMB.W.Kidney.N]